VNNAAKNAGVQIPLSHEIPISFSLDVYPEERVLGLVVVLVLGS
jgi:hypothetical protein